MNESQKTKCKSILLHYGIESQQRMLVEECGELIQAVMKLYRKNYHAESVRDLFSEIADVEIMIEQVKQFYNYETNRIIDYKLARQLDRIKKEV